MRTMKAIQSSHAARTAVSFQDMLAKVVGAPAAVWVWLHQRSEKARSRIVLSELTDSELDDIGVTRAEARRESCRPFWN